MPENAMLVLHYPSGLVAGTAADMRATADALDKMAAAMVAAYRDKSGAGDTEIAALMAAETWCRRRRRWSWAWPTGSSGGSDGGPLRPLPLPQPAAAAGGARKRHRTGGRDVRFARPDRASVTRSKPRPPTIPLPRQAVSRSRVWRTASRSGRPPGPRERPRPIPPQQPPRSRRRRPQRRPRRRPRRSSTSTRSVPTSAAPRSPMRRGPRALRYRRPGRPRRRLYRQSDAGRADPTRPARGPRRRGRGHRHPQPGPTGEHRAAPAVIDTAAIYAARNQNVR